MINTVLGNVSESEINVALSHEHICCYSEYLYMMAGDRYLDKNKLADKAVSELKKLKENYGMNLFLDCTPINIGRDVELLKTVSEKSGVHIVCSTGFYYTDEVVFHNTDEKTLASYMVCDARNINAGMIKVAVEDEYISEFNKKLLRAACIARSELDLPIVLHTNARRKNALEALEILTDSGVKPQGIVVGHMSDTEDFEYIKEVAKYDCFIALDRLYEKKDTDYINKKVITVLKLCEAGYEDKILVSHDECVFNGFAAEPQIKDHTRLGYAFEHILPMLDESIVNKIKKQNPIEMLRCGKR